MEKNYSKISEFILKRVKHHSSDLVPFVAKQFGFSRQRAHAYVVKEVRLGRILKVGRTRATRYFLVGGKHIEFALEIKPGLEEDRIWSEYIKPMVSNYPDNISAICSYGFTEILNNAIDHSDGTSIYIEVTISQGELEMTIMDNGVGIFQKIQNALHLESIKESLFHLSKGKFTTDPKNHTGQGIFFTSRIFNKFSILSSDLQYTFKGEEWFLSHEKGENFGQGTSIQMVVSLNSKITPKQIMDKYANVDIGFTKTIVAVALSADPNDPHVSRSQAKRLVMGLEKFKTVVLDFKGVKSVGQAFVDQIFRVFQNEHPEIIIRYVNTNSEVESMIKRGLNAQP